MLVAYLATRRGCALIGKVSLGVLAFCYGGLLSAALLGALRIEADSMLVESAQALPADQHGLQTLAEDPSESGPAAPSAGRETLQGSQVQHHRFRTVSP